MDFTLNHVNINVTDMARSINFYEEALGMRLLRKRDAQDGSYTIVYMTDGESGMSLELTWLRDHTEAYDLTDNEIHIAFTTKDFEAARRHHKAMGCISFENNEIGIYFIEDPDGYWLEIVPNK